MTGYIYIFITILLSVYGQLILKWRLTFLGDLPASYREQFRYIFIALLDPYIISSFVAAFVASITWIAALTKFDLSYAYPFMSLSFIVVLIMSYLLFAEPLTLSKAVGIMLIISGLFIASR